MKKIIRTATVPLSLDLFCRGLLHELSEDYEVVALSSPGEVLKRIAGREGVRTLAIPMRRSIAPVQDVISLWRLVRAFRKERPRMIHSITPKAGLLSMLAAWMTGVPVRVHTFTGLLFPTAQGWRKKLLMLTDRVTCACATHIIAEGEGVKNDLVHYKIARKPVRILGHGNVRGIDLDYYNRTPEVLRRAAVIQKKYGMGDDDFTFIFVGRIVRDKGIDELAAAFNRLSQKYSCVHLLLVGDEETESAPISAETRQLLSANKQIHIVNWQNDVRPWYAAADALVFPSYREGFPNVVIEAGAMGLPAVVTDINGSREIIRTGENGVIVPPRNEEKLYEAMKRMLEHPLETEAYGKNARPLIASRYEQGYVRQCLKDYYKYILK